MEYTAVYGKDLRSINNENLLKRSFENNSPIMVTLSS